jgi:hypothetical protein
MEADRIIPHICALRLGGQSAAIGPRADVHLPSRAQSAEQWKVSAPLWTSMTSPGASPSGAMATSASVVLDDHATRRSCCQRRQVARPRGAHVPRRRRGAARPQRRRRSAPRLEVPATAARHGSRIAVVMPSSTPASPPTAPEDELVIVDPGAVGVPALAPAQGVAEPAGRCSAVRLGARRAAVSRRTPR